jgi:putative transposase
LVLNQMGISMTWTAIARAEYNRDTLRFPSDLTDREWALIAPLISPAKRSGRPRTTDMRDVVEAILFIASPAVAPVTCAAWVQG